jgi:tRNA-2-methylthio-N6-dimethylallyladenosine synthase
VVPLARGPEISRPPVEIIAEIKQIDFKKFPRLVLLGQNVNSYRRGNFDFADLLEKIHEIEGPKIIEFLTSHPKDTSEKLIQAIKRLPKISRTIHLPLQSGDNQILKLMNRDYTVEDYKKLVEKIRQQIPGAKISTDIIVGFPGETEEKFQNTLKAVREIGFCRVNCAAFSPRPKTAAAALPGQLPTAEKARRLQILLNLVKEITKK